MFLFFVFACLVIFLMIHFLHFMGQWHDKYVANNGAESLENNGNFWEIGNLTFMATGTTRNKKENTTGN